MECKQRPEYAQVRLQRSHPFEPAHKIVIVLDGIEGGEGIRLESEWHALALQVPEHRGMWETAHMAVQFDFANLLMHTSFCFLRPRHCSSPAAACCLRI